MQSACKVQSLSAQQLWTTASKHLQPYQRRKMKAIAATVTFLARKLQHQRTYVYKFELLLFYPILPLGGTGSH